MVQGISQVRRQGQRRGLEVFWQGAHPQPDPHGVADQGRRRTSARASPCRSGPAGRHRRPAGAIHRADGHRHGRARRRSRRSAGRSASTIDHAGRVGAPCADLRPRMALALPPERGRGAEDHPSQRPAHHAQRRPTARGDRPERVHPGAGRSEDTGQDAAEEGIAQARRAAGRPHLGAPRPDQRQPLVRQPQQLGARRDRGAGTAGRLRHQAVQERRGRRGRHCRSGEQLPPGARLPERAALGRHTAPGPPMDRLRRGARRRLPP